MVDKIQVPTDPSQDQLTAQQAHDAAMAARAQKELEGNQPPAPPAPAAPTAERPAWLPEKFWNAEKGEANYEALAQSYAHLERGKPAAAPPVTPPATPPALNADGTPVTPPAAPAADPAAARTAAMEAAEADYSANGALSDSTYEALEAAGYPKAQVDAYIAGQVAVATAETQRVYGAVGGEAAFKAMTEWAGTALPQADIEAFNSVLDTGNIGQIEHAVKGLAARYKAEAPMEPGVLGGAAPGSSSGEHYKSRFDMQKDMGSTAYSKDPAFRASVASKMANSAKLGINLFAQ